MKVQNKTICQCENVEDEHHCIVNMFVKYLIYIPSRDKHFYHRPLPDNGSGLPRFGTQPLGRNTLAKITPDMCKAAGIQGNKTGHSGKVTCATVLYQQDFSDQLIKERTGHRSLEALHKYKRTGSDQQYEVSMALLPPSTVKPCSSGGDNESKFKCKENRPVSDDDDDFIKPVKKKPKVTQDDIKAMFPQSSLTNCTFNINFNN